MFMLSRDSRACLERTKKVSRYLIPIKLPAYHMHTNQLTQPYQGTDTSDLEALVKK